MASNRGFQKKLLTWFKQNKRDLPWRRTRDPYLIWISEVMLQQTQVKTVLPYYERFVARFPDLQSLSQASESEVVAAWSGLGYYSRARNLHRAARAIVANGPGFPKEFSAILQLPGIGRYTAGAIASIAFGARYPVVDGNVRRFLSRYFGRALDESECWPIAQSLLPERNAGDFNQALMEIGATICKPDDPLCLLCPLSEGCQTKGRPLPGLRKSVPAVRQNMAMLALRKKEKFWMEDRGPEPELLRNLWCFPMQLGAEPADALARRLLARFGVRRAKQVGHFTHSIMKYRFQISLLSAAARGGTAGKGAWVHPRDFQEYPHSSLVKKAMRLVQNQ
ncbi:MAG TPA: A/G-specific adenine glycosylase [Acidobacteriota bacterium]|jgi:A/G-specific adenine glycosylase